jgi:hypothetical protein
MAGTEYPLRDKTIQGNCPVSRWKEYVRRTYCINSKCPRQVWAGARRNNSRQKPSRAKLALRMQSFLIRAPAISSSAMSGSGTAAISMAFLADCRFQHRHTNAQCALSLIITDIFQPDRRRL